MEKIKILHVDDNDEIRLAFRLTLESLDLGSSINITMFQAANSSEALRVYQNEKPDLVVTDYDLQQGNMNGLVLARMLLSTRPTLPIMLMTGSLDNPEVIDGATELGLRTHEKPFDRSKLTEQIKSMIDEII